MADPTPESGRVLDAEVESEVMGERVAWIDADGDYGTPCGINGCWCQPVPHRSTDIAAAWEVVEKLNEMGFYVTVARTTDGRSFCRLMESNNWVGDGIRVGPTTAPLAICKAALAAVRADTEGADD